MTSQGGLARAPWCGLGVGRIRRKTSAATLAHEAVDLPTFSRTLARRGRPGDTGTEALWKPGGGFGRGTRRSGHGLPPAIQWRRAHPTFTSHEGDGAMCSGRKTGSEITSANEPRFEGSTRRQPTPNKDLPVMSGCCTSSGTVPSASQSTAWRAVTTFRAVCR